MGANITLSCWDQGPQEVPVAWRVQEWGAAPGGGRWLPEGGRELLLRGVRAEDSGRYSCWGGGRPLRSLRLLVEDPPEPPRVSCSRRSFDRAVLCEWPLRSRPSPGTRAMLWVKPWLAAGNTTEQRCRHFARARRFVCRVTVPPGTDDTKPLVVSSCATNHAGGSAGQDLIITLNGILRPDPPLNVTVAPVEKAPRRLRVSWSYPPSWDPRFYRLHFQLRYRPEPAPTFLQVGQVTRTWLELGDAWGGTRHVVQVRAQEEFGHGSWSEWSREALGTPWTDPGDLTSEMGPFSSQFPMEDGTDGVTLPPELFREDGDGTGEPVVEATPHPVTTPSTLLVAGGSLVLGIALSVAIVVRYRRTWRGGGRRRGAKPEGEGHHHVLMPLGPPSPPLSDTPLLSPPPAPPALRVLHVTNLDYFFSGQ
ncbi:LOW QUALITY PROTEIN: interleukin-6 receptor subunit alpha [Aegotheles albertisi]